MKLAVLSPWVYFTGTDYAWNIGRGLMSTSYLVV